MCLGGLANVGYHGYQKNIFEFDYETESWTKIGVMKEKLSNHALSVLSYDEYANEYAKWCNWINKVLDDLDEHELIVYENIITTPLMRGLVFLVLTLGIEWHLNV